MTTSVATRQRAGRNTGTFALVAVVAFVTTLDNTIIAVALPSAARALRFGAAELEWVGISYLLTFSGLLLVAGELVDRWGQRRSLLVGLVAFGLAATAGGLAGTVGLLIAARAAQGAAAALVMPATLSVLRTSMADRQRDTAAAVWTAALAVALAVGPLVGGLLTQYLRWNWVLLVNVPIAALAIGLAARCVPEHRAPASRPIDWPGALLTTVTAVCLTVLLVNAAGSTRLVFGAVAVLTAGLLVGHTRRTPAPLVPVVLLGHRVFRTSLLVQLLWGLSVSGIFFFTPLFLQEAVRLSPAGSGLPLLVVAVAVAAGTPFAGRATARFGVGRPAGLGLALVAAGLLAVAAAGRQPSIGALAPGLAMVGLGSAFTAPVTATALAAAGTDRAGIASGVLTASRELASSLGVALVGLVFTLRRSAALLAGYSQPASYAEGYRWALLLAAGLVAGAALLSWRRLDRR